MKVYGERGVRHLKTVGKLFYKKLPYNFTSFNILNTKRESTFLENIFSQQKTKAPSIKSPVSNFPFWGYETNLARKVYVWYLNIMSILYYDLLKNILLLVMTWIDLPIQGGLMKRSCPLITF